MLLLFYFDCLRFWKILTTPLPTFCFIEFRRLNPSLAVEPSDESEFFLLPELFGDCDRRELPWGIYVYVFCISKTVFLLDKMIVLPKLRTFYLLTGVFFYWNILKSLQVGSKRLSTGGQCGSSSSPPFR